MPMKRQGLSLSEIMIATVLLTLAAIPVITVFGSSRQIIQRTDERREKRYFLSEILARAQRHSLQTLWDAFGPYFVGAANCGYMRDRIVELDGNNKIIRAPGAAKDPNPLGLTQDFVDDLFYQGYETRIRFEFYPRADLGVEPAVFKPNGRDKAGPYGLLHMQSGFLTVAIRDKADPSDRADWRVPMMCPAIVGRPGLKMEGCPALDTDKRREYGPRILAREAEWSNQPPLF
jgi:hypothetical protein